MSGKRLFAVRGATTTERNTEQEILSQTKTLLQELIDKNDLSREQDIVSVMFTATKDLTACFPAKAARKLGWTNTPLMCAQEIDVDDSLPKCIRVLIQYYAPEDHSPQAVYLKDARKLRPDLINE
ncbi:chorismate mutase [Natranaerobius thermophilus]|uniref:chorismate mutase n=1 Tax=Natranaerobius thermophilus (strain ATCC BAA-1301 / DSM 18059 / JW/NM-WN-LF) TaxID=457570 RepID=B2A4P0_NATTJ|nr:chorismate mutase [Natranaerobius thermophilus]ACB85215.1 chorismate mutase [Natranaerobius thermophilus JW/NM-WN-LF]